MRWSSESSVIGNLFACRAEAPRTSLASAVDREGKRLELLVGEQVAGAGQPTTPVVYASASQWVKSRTPISWYDDSGPGR